MTDKDDQQFEDWLKGGSTVSRAYDELRDDKPSATLDALILAEARSAVTANDGQDDDNVIRLRHWRRWSLPAALAASVIVAVPLVVRVFEAPSAPAVDRGEFAARPPAEAPGVADESESPVRTESLANGGAALTDADQTRALARAGNLDRRAALPGERDALSPAEEAEMQAAGDPQSVRDDALADRSQSREQAQTAPAAGRANALKVEPAPYQSSRPRRPPGPLPAPAGAPREPSPATLTEGPVASARADAEADTASLKSRSTPGRSAAQGWLDAIGALHALGRVDTARRQLGEFLLRYPDYELPAAFPLRERDAVYTPAAIVQPAAQWLDDIATLAEAGRIDAARQQLARFFERYPDYELPANFPLTRADAGPIER